MNKEEFERLKQKEKEHLLKLRQIKGRLKEAQRTARLRQAVEGISGSLNTSELDEALDRVQMESLDSEIRLDMALETAEAKEQKSKIEQEMEAFEQEVGEEAARKARAAQLVAQMKATLGTPSDVRPAGTKARPESDAPEAQEKSLGRTPDDDDEADGPQSPSDAPDSLPEKTIGRAARRR